MRFSSIATQRPRRYLYVEAKAQSWYVQLLFQTTDIFEFAKGQSLANHLSLVGVGRPYSCTSHALHEGAIKECYDLINPISPLRSFSCFSKALDIDIGTGAGFQPSYQNIYQACIESICAHGPAAKCYYIDKLISKIQQSCPTTPPNILSDIRKGLNCGKTSLWSVVY